MGLTYYVAFVGYVLALTSFIDATPLNDTTSTSRLSRAISLPAPLRIGAFNIKTFGRAKMSDPYIAQLIREIVLRYDLILIQEIRDSTGSALDQLHEMVGRSTYGLTVSERLGRTTYKEEYAYFYRYERLGLVAVHQYSDPGDIFEREPFSALFKPIGGSWEFSVVGFHAKPSDAVAEIAALIDVYDDVRRTWTSSQDVVIMGDFNAACSYASESDLQPLPIYNEDFFLWPLGFDVDTTTGNSVCAYDSAAQTSSRASICSTTMVYDYPVINKSTVSNRYRWMWLRRFVVQNRGRTPPSVRRLNQIRYFIQGIRGRTPPRFVLAGDNIRQAFIPGSEDIFRYEVAFDLTEDVMLDVSDHYPIEFEIY